MMALASSTHSKSHKTMDQKVDPVLEVVEVVQCGSRSNRKTRILSAHNLRKTSAIKIMEDVAVEAVEVVVVDREGEEMGIVAEAGGVDIMMMVVTAAVEEAKEATITITEGEEATAVVVVISHGETGRTMTVETQVIEAAVVVVTIEDAVAAILVPLETQWLTNNVSKNPDNPTDSRMMAFEGLIYLAKVDSGEKAFSGEGDGFVQVSSPLKVVYFYCYLFLRELLNLLNQPQQQKHSLPH